MHRMPCKSLSKKEPLIIGLFCGEWHMKIRHPMGLRHPVLRVQSTTTTRKRVAVCWTVLRNVAMCCIVLKYGAVCCSVLQCVVVCCSVLQRGIE